MTEPSWRANVELARRWAQCSSQLLQPIDAAWLVAFRVLFGMTMAVSLLRFIAYGWIDELFVTPRFHFKYWGFAWVGDPTSLEAHAAFYALTALALCVAAGLMFRAASLAFAIGFAALQLIDVTNYLNHYYLATLLAFMLALSPAGRRWSLDAWLRERRRRRRAASTEPSAGAAPPARVARAWLYSFRFQVGIVYTFAGLAKAQADWLIHAQPLGVWLGARTDLPLLGPLFRLPSAPLLVSWAGFLFDLSIVFWLLTRRVRPFAYAAIIVFHVITSALFPIGMFPVIMILAALVFFDPSWPRELLSRFNGKGGAHLTKPEAPLLANRVPAPTPASAARALGPRLALALGMLYCVTSLAMPLRWLTYGGDVLWHEQGMRWSWRVMVREKNGSVTFRVREPITEREWRVPPRTYLTQLQEREMSGQPDLILQLAHRIRDDAERQLGTRVEVRAETLASLNGRRARPLIDPSVDLARVEDGLGFATWILPAGNDAPRAIRPI